MRKAYIIGPSVGLPKLNLELFEKVAAVAVTKGLEPVVPHHLFNDEENERSGISFTEALCRRREELECCDVAIMIPGYSEDRFGCIEAFVAMNMGLQRLRLDELKIMSNARAII
jgi:hypothetical protein